MHRIIPRSLTRDQILSWISVKSTTCPLSCSSRLTPPMGELGLTTLMTNLTSQVYLQLDSSSLKFRHTYYNLINSVIDCQRVKTHVTESMRVMSECHYLHQCTYDMSSSLLLVIDGYLSSQNSYHTSLHDFQCPIENY